jgi:type III restriction enzyme
LAKSDKEVPVEGYEHSDAKRINNPPVGLAHLDRDETPTVTYAYDPNLLEIPYQYFGNTYRYRPDFMVKLTNGKTLLVEGKGVATEQDDAKATAARRWVQAVNNWGQLGSWDYELIFDANDLANVLESHSTVLEAIE